MLGKSKRVYRLEYFGEVNIMLNYQFASIEEELLHIIRVNGSTYEEYQNVVEKVQNLNYTDDNDRSFLHTAVSQRKTDIAIDLMRRGIDVNLQDVNGYTAAQFAVSDKQWEILMEILKYHPDVNLKDWRYGNSLLLDIVQYKNETSNQIAKELLKMGANPYAQNRNGLCPLDIVVQLENQELIEAFQQIAKPQYEELERFRVPKKAGGFFVVKIRDYQKYILVENTTLQYLEDKIIDYATICGGKKVPYKFELVSIKDSHWNVVHCPEKMDFYNYHNLMSWIWGLPEDVNPPSKSICVAQHKNDERLSYYGIMDKHRYGDARLVGRFQNGESFSIYLPDAFKKDGNAQSFRDALPIKSITQYLSSCGFDEAWLNKSFKKADKEVVVEMAL